MGNEGTEAVCTAVERGEGETTRKQEVKVKRKPREPHAGDSADLRREPLSCCSFKSCIDVP